MIAGAILYALSFDWVKSSILSVGKLGKVTLPQMLGVSHAVLYAALAALMVVFFVFLEKKRL